MPLTTAATSIRLDSLLTGLFALIFLAVGVYAAAIPQGSRRWTSFAVLMAALILAGLNVQVPALRVALLDLAALCAAGMLWVQPAARRAARIYTVTMLAAMVLAGLGLWMAGLLTADSAAQPTATAAKIAAALLIAGFALKLALAPFYFWLPGVAGASTPLTSGLIVATLDMAELGELITLRQSAAWVFGEHTAVWLALAVLSMLGGALLALAQRDLKRMLAFSTVDDMGYLLLGVLAGPGAGLTGATFGLVSHALCKVLLFGALGVAEKGIGEPVNLDCRGLATRFPVSSAMFITGALGMIGVPPLVGFAGRFRLYLVGYQIGGAALLVVMALATALALIYYVRAIHQVWFGPLPGRVESSARAEPWPAAAALIALALVALALGVFPGLLQVAL